MKNIGERITEQNKNRQAKFNTEIRLRLLDFFNKALKNAEQCANGKAYKRPSIDSKIYTFWPFSFSCLSEEISKMDSEDGPFSGDWALFKKECNAVGLTPVLVEEYKSTWWPNIVWYVKYELTFKEIGE